VSNPTEEPIVDPLIDPTPTEPTPTDPTPPADTKEIQKKAYKHAMDQIDSSLKELGFEKPDGVKTSDFLKEVLAKGTKEPAPMVTPTTDDKDSIINQLKATLQEKDDAIAELSLSTTKAKKEMFVDSLLSQAQLNIPENLSEPEKARMSGILRNALKSEIEKEIEFRDIDGQFRAYHKDGRPVLDDKADYLEPSKIIEKNFSEFLAKAPQPNVPKGTGGTPKSEPVPSVIPSNVKTKYDFYAYLNNEKGYVTNSKDFIDAMSKAKEENPAMFIK